MLRLPVGAAVRKFLVKLQENDPVALGLFGFVVLLAAVAGAIWLLDRKNEQASRSKSKGSSRRR